MGSRLVHPVVIVASFVTAWALAGATFLAYEFYQGSFLVTGWIMWLAFTVARMLVDDLFIGLWPPSGV